MTIDEIEIGMQVRYHPVIGGQHDGELYTIRCAGFLCNQFVVWLKGKSGCVDIAAVSIPQEESK